MHTFSSGNTAIRLRQYEPAGVAPRPAILLLHGAGGNVNLWFDRLAPVLAHAGIALYAPHYFDRTATTTANLAMILDGKHVPLWLATANDALSYISTRPGVDRDRIALLGISLGAFLSLALGTETDAHPIKAIVELSGGLAAPWDSRVKPAFPPTLILHGENDNVVPVAEAHKAAGILQSQNIPHQTEIFPGEDHWFSASTKTRILALVATFLAEHL